MTGPLNDGVNEELNRISNFERSFIGLRNTLSMSLSLPKKTPSRSRLPLAPQNSILLLCPSERSLTSRRREALLQRSDAAPPFDSDSLFFFFYFLQRRILFLCAILKRRVTFTFESVYISNEGESAFLILFLFCFLPSYGMCVFWNKSSITVVYLFFFLQRK